MAWFWFGGSPGTKAIDGYLVDATGARVEGATAGVKDAATGTVLTDLLDEAGAPATSIISGLLGYVTFAAQVPIVDVTSGSYTFRLISSTALVDAVSIAGMVESPPGSGLFVGGVPQTALAADAIVASVVTDPVSDTRGVLDATYVPIGGLTDAQVAAAVARALGWIIATDTLYGADPTGATDSASAINSALAAAVGKTVYLPAGTYLLTANHLGIPAGTTLRGAGRSTTVRTATSNRNLITATAVSAVTVCDLRLVGVGTASSSTGSAINFVDVTDSVIRNVIVEDPEHQGINVGKTTTGCSNVTIEGCLVTGANKSTAGCGIIIADSTRCRVAHNNVRGNRIGISLNDATDCIVQGNIARANTVYGITIDGLVGGAGLAARCVISGNTVTGQTDGANGDGIYLGNRSVDCSIIGNNSSSNAQSGIKISDNCNGNTVTGNTCASNAAQGIRILVSSVGTVISGNTLRANGGSGVSLEGESHDTTMQGNRTSGNTQCGIKVFQSHRVSVAGNILTGNGQRGLLVQQSDLATVTGNTVTDNGTATPGTTFDGILLDTTNRCSVTANTASNTVLTGGNQRYGIRTQAGTLNMVVGNVAFQNITGQVSASAGTDVAANNIIT